MSRFRGDSSGDDKSGHLPVLDGIRGLAILLVTAYRFDIGPEYGQLPGSLVFQILRHGDMGVDLFFVLSGFLITGILFDARGRKHYFRNFYARRALRIFPLYYGFLFVTLVAPPALCGPEYDLFPEAESNQAWLWLYGANLLVAVRDSWCLGSFDHFWSLSVEEHFYFLWPLVIFFFCASRRWWPVCWRLSVRRWEDSFGFGSAEVARLWKRSLFSDSTDLPRERFWLWRRVAPPVSDR